MVVGSIVTFVIVTIDGKLELAETKYWGIIVIIIVGFVAIGIIVVGCVIIGFVTIGWVAIRGFIVKKLAFLVLSL